jgi:putative sterol carrier protein
VSATDQIFDELAGRGHEPLLERVTGTVRIELLNGRPDHWLVAIDKGDLTVSHEDGPADSGMRLKRETFARMAAGDENEMTAFLRGEVQLEGNWELLVLFRRVLPGPDRERRAA